MKVGFIGAGNMGGAIARATSRVLSTDIYISDNNVEKAALLAEEIGANKSDNNTIFETCDFIFIGVKPAYVKDVAKAAFTSLSANPEAVIVSMAAGVTTASLSEYFGNREIIRIMPNTPIAVGEGLTTYATNELVQKKSEDAFLEIMSESGRVDKLPENLIDAACAVAGCGPAFVYMFIDALADGAVECGLPRDKAIAYAAATLKGASEMVMTTGEHPAKLKDAVCSPGGSTIEGVHALEESNFRCAAINAVVKAYEKTKKLGKK